MESVTEPRTTSPVQQSPPAEPPRSHGASIVTGIYLALVVCAPFVVRYAPQPGVYGITTVATPANKVTCAPSSGSSLSCPPTPGANAASSAVR